MQESYSCQLHRQVLPMYCQSTFNLLWAELFLDLLLCRRVTVAGLHCQVLPMYCQSTFNLFWAELFLDLLLCRRVTVASCTAKCFQCTVRVLSIFFGLNFFLTYSCAGELQSPGCTVCCQVLPMYCQSTFNLSGEVTSVVLFQ